MRIEASNNNILPFYRDKKYLYSRQCPSCGPLIKAPIRRGGNSIITSVPSVELIYEGTNTFLATGLVKSKCNSVVYPVYFDRSIKTINGIDYTFFNINAGLNLPEGSYYIEVIEISDGDPNLLCSEEFCATNQSLCWLISYSTSCDSPNGSQDYTREFFIDEIDLVEVTENSEIEKTNADSSIETSFLSSKRKGTFSILGNDHIYDSLSSLKLFKNITLENTSTGEKWDMKEISVQRSAGSCQYNIDIEFVKSIATSAECCDIDSPFIDPCVNSPIDPVDCEGYNVVINNNGNILTFTETTVGTTPSSIQWLINGAPSGNGSSVSLGAYGTYTVQLNNGVCNTSDSFTYNDPCATMSLTVSANGPVISGSATGDNNIVFSICNSANVEIGTGLPFTVPESEGDGYFTVKAQGDNCPKQATVYVTVTPEFDCEHNATIDYNNGILTGSSTGCTDPLTNEFIDLEDENGNLSIVSNTNTFTPLVTGLYWYNAICNGCPKRVRKLVIISDTNEGPTGTCDDPFYYIECETPSSGTETKVELPK